MTVPMQGIITPAQFNSYLVDVGIDVKSLGAKGDGVTDDSTVIQNALQNYDLLYFPAGTYYCSTALILDWHYSSSNKVIIGASKETTTILFKDQTNITNACLSLDVASFSMTGMTIKYIAQSVAAWNTTNGLQGNLVGLFKGKGYFHNCKFIVLDSRITPSDYLSCTCFWAKATYGAIPKLTISNCEFRNETGSTLDGCLWVSCQDTGSGGCNITHVEVMGNDFYRNGHDEVISFWSGSNNIMSDIDVHDNVFSYTGTAEVDQFVSFYRKDTGNIIDNVRVYNNKFTNSTACDFGHVYILRFNQVKAKVYANEFIFNTNNTFDNFIGIETGADVAFYDNDCQITSNTNFSLIQYIGGKFNCRNNNFNITCNTFMFLENDNTSIPSADLNIRFNEINCTLTTTSASIIYAQLWDSGIIDISENLFNYTSSNLQTITFTFTCSTPTTPVSHEVKIRRNKFSTGFNIQGNSNSLKILTIEENFSSGLFSFYYPAVTSYSKLIVKNNISSDFQYNEGTITLANLTTIASNYLWINNYKYADLTTITPS